jgi:hypothetical protein
VSGSCCLSHSAECSPLQLFCKENRQAIKEKNPEASAVDMMKLVASAWQAAGAEEKAPFVAEHQVGSLEAAVLRNVLRLLCSGNLQTACNLFVSHSHSSPDQLRGDQRTKRKQE